MSQAIKEFSRFAYQYDKYNEIQSEVAKKLVSQIPIKSYECIIDVGCGSGEVYKNIKKNGIHTIKFIALDSSEEMLSLHPNNIDVEKLIANFNHQNIFNKLSLSSETLMVSSSALQWSTDLDFTFSQLAKQAKEAYFAIFTANTFKTLHKAAGIQSPIYEEEILKDKIQKYYYADFELIKYRLEFETIREMFTYIKKSGVSGGERQLTYQKIKALMNEYPLKYLEFEVLFVRATSLAKSK